MIGAPDLFDWSERYPVAPGFKERGGASEAAAEAMKAAAPTIRERVLACLKSIGAQTADECAHRLGEDILAVRPRFSELQRRGLIEKTSDRRPNRSGTLATVWRAI